VYIYLYHSHYYYHYCISLLLYYIIYIYNHVYNYLYILYYCCLPLTIMLPVLNIILLWCVAVALNYCFCCMNNTYPSISCIVYTYVVASREIKIAAFCINALCRVVTLYLTFSIRKGKVYLGDGII
jgi:hypothetical protein